MDLTADELHRIVEVLNAKKLKELEEQNAKLRTLLEQTKCSLAYKPVRPNDKTG